MSQEGKAKQFQEKIEERIRSQWDTHVNGWVGRLQIAERVLRTVDSQRTPQVGVPAPPIGYAEIIELARVMKESEP